MPPSKPRKVTDLPSPLANPSPITRDHPDTDARAHARPPARAYTRDGVGTQAPAVAARAVETAGQALAAVLDRAAERREALAAAVALARASQVPDEELRARLLLTRIGKAEIDAAMA